VYLHVLFRSNLISQNTQTYKDEYDHFNTLYRQAESKKEKLHAEIEKSQIQLFQPKINPKSSTKVKDTFEERLQRSLIQKKKNQDEGELDS
jgi:ribosomal protein L24